MQTTSSTPAYQPDHYDPLLAMPAELIDYRLTQAEQSQNTFSEGRPYLFYLLSHDDLLGRRTIWKYIFPYRSISTCCPTSTEAIEQVYQAVLSSLESWFSVHLLSPANFTLWSVSMTLSMMRNIGNDFEAKSILIHLAIQDVKELFHSATPSQLRLLDRRLKTFQ